MYNCISFLQSANGKRKKEKEKYNWKKKKNYKNKKWRKNSRYRHCRKYNTSWNQSLGGRRYDSPSNHVTSQQLSAQLSVFVVFSLRSQSCSDRPTKTRFDVCHNKRQKIADSSRAPWVQKGRRCAQKVLKYRLAFRLGNWHLQSALAVQFKYGIGRVGVQYKYDRGNVDTESWQSRPSMVLSQLSGTKRHFSLPPCYSSSLLSFDAWRNSRTTTVLSALSCLFRLWE